MADIYEGEFVLRCLETARIRARFPGIVEQQVPGMYKLVRRLNVPVKEDWPTPTRVMFALGTFEVGMWDIPPMRKGDTATLEVK